MPTRLPANKRPDSLRRSERKDQTRTSLLQAALHLIGQGRSTDELGLALVAQAGPSAHHLNERKHDTRKVRF
ncbi:MAG: hypothetical protein GZ093_05600 [Rhodoferax sp.]|uniref:hypothetical protein n=1 Tax=Rhodoferax sp. TaxID=50421 RepID=UPI0014007B8C|nr:hypothetical protein [Rhodoferax sp.]NDP38212.1 hypothetical protein [Rhodoferax sp.]